MEVPQNRSATSEPARVSRTEGGGAFYLATDRVNEVRAVLDANAVPYWMDPSAISDNGGPHVSRVALGVKADIDLVERFFSSLPLNW